MLRSLETSFNFHHSFSAFCGAKKVFHDEDLFGIIPNKQLLRSGHKRKIELGKKIRAVENGSPCFEMTKFINFRYNLYEVQF